MSYSEHVAMPGASLARAAGMNMYNYVGSDPVNFVDPWGLKNDRPMPQHVYYRIDSPPLDICASGRRVNGECVSRSQFEYFIGDLLAALKFGQPLHFTQRGDLVGGGSGSTSAAAENMRECNLAQATSEKMGVALDGTADLTDLEAAAFSAGAATAFASAGRAKNPREAVARGTVGVGLSILAATTEVATVVFGGLSAAFYAASGNPAKPAIERMVERSLPGRSKNPSKQRTAADRGKGQVAGHVARRLTALCKIK